MADTSAIIIPKEIVKKLIKFWWVAGFATQAKQSDKPSWARTVGRTDQGFPRQGEQLFKQFITITFTIPPNGQNRVPDSAPFRFREDVGYRAFCAKDRCHPTVNWTGKMANNVFVILSKGTA